jgi:hypothetical protein
MPTSVRATPEERLRSLPGDELIPAAVGSLTNAVTIARPPADVWPWLAQMGAGRAGWYSYDWLDNGGRPSAWRIKPDLQAPATGDVFPALPGRRDGFTLVAQDPQRSLVLSWPKPEGGHAVTWSFVLDPLGGSRTRLLVRARGGAGYRFHGLPEWLSLAAVRPVHFVMERKQLIGIARRAEREPGTENALLDQFVPAYDIVERHQIRVEAPPDVTFAAACHVDFQRSRIIHAIVRGREWMMGSRADDRAGPRGLLAETKAMGWGVLAEHPRHAIVMGAVTKPWEPDVTFRALAPDAFASFAEPGVVKIAWTLEAERDGGGSIARTETRAVATDGVSRAKFRRYWRRVWPGIVVIRWVALRLVKRDAERQAARSATQART